MLRLYYLCIVRRNTHRDGVATGISSLKALDKHDAVLWIEALRRASTAP